MMTSHDGWNFDCVVIRLGQLIWFDLPGEQYCDHVFNIIAPNSGVNAGVQFLPSSASTSTLAEFSIMFSFHTQPPTHQPQE